jgi:hypothetical protein
MGSQIGIVQSPTDEAEFFVWLQQRGRLSAVPRTQSVEKFVPVPPESCEAQEQFIFPESESQEILRHVSHDKARSGLYLIRRSLVAGRVIEWDRTERIASNEFRPGRFYIDNMKDGRDEIQQFIKNAMTAIQRHVRDTYPMRSTHRHPIYVGPHMAQLLREGKGRINPKSFEMRLVDNA